MEAINASIGFDRRLASQDIQGSIAHSAMLAPILRALRSLTWLAFALVVLIALATAAAVVLGVVGIAIGGVALVRSRRTALAPGK